MKRRLITWACWLSLGVSLSADDWVLTGLTRTDEQVRAYLRTADDVCVTLRVGEERWGMRLVGISFAERCAWLADATRTTRVECAGSPRLSQGPHGEFQPPDASQQAAAGVNSNYVPLQLAESAGAKFAQGTDFLSFGSAPAAGDPLRGDAVPAEVTSASPAWHPRRPATADELFRSRQGYGAWEALLRRRHEAEFLGLPPPEP